MRYRGIAAMAVALVFGAAPLAQAGEAASPHFNVMGPASCANWPKNGDISSAAKAVPLNWALGFLSGWAAQGRLELLDVIDPQAVNDWLTTYCKDHPTAPLPLAVRELERDLEAKLPPPPAPAQDQAPMFVPPTVTTPPPATPAPKPAHRTVRKKAAKPAPSTPPAAPPKT